MASLTSHSCNYLLLFALVFLTRCAPSAAEHHQSVNQESYSCTPCGQSCDNGEYTVGGTCKVCQMPLVKKNTINFKTINPSEICEYIRNHPQVVLLDVRTKQEFEGKANPNFGALKNAINIPVQELESELNRLGAYRDKEIIVYCSHSRRSPRASYILIQNGFKHVTNMAGGMSAMNDADCKDLRKN